MHPYTIFCESILLFVLGLILILRDRGCAVSSLEFDSLLGSVLVVFALIRMFEFFAGYQEGYIFGRGIYWCNWLIPAVIMSCLLYYNRRIDIFTLWIVSLVFIVVSTVFVISGAGGFDVIPPNSAPGESNGIYTWLRTDGQVSFMPLVYYILLGVTVGYMISVYWSNAYYIALSIAAGMGYFAATMLIPEVRKNPLATVGSLSSLIMIGIGTFAVLLVPG